MLFVETALGKRWKTILGFLHQELGSADILSGQLRVERTSFEVSQDSTCLQA